MDFNKLNDKLDDDKFFKEEPEVIPEEISITKTGAEPESGTSLLLKAARRQNRLLTILIAVLAAGCILTASSVFTLYGGVKAVQAEVSELKMDEVNEAVAALTEAANTLSSIDMETFNATADSLRQAADTLTGVDIGVLNNAVKSLDEAAANLSELDMDAFNSVIQSLQSVAERLEKISNFFSGGK
ncbi:MAG: hypothetical protein K5637_03710 [Lachnospiraceae bacterium]|nr:hypothetical protein [Lachnospiraceae bacterium]